MQEYALRFFVLLRAAIREDAQQKIELIYIASSPHLKASDRNKLINSYKKVITEEKVDDEKIKRDRELLLKTLKGKML